MMHGGQLRGPGILKKRARDFLDEFQRANTHLSLNSNMDGSTCWCPPALTHFKLNFDAAIFSNQAASGVGVIIRNDRGEVMASLSAKGPPATSSEEAEIMACRRAMEFAIECGFSKLIVDVDNKTVMSSLRSKKCSPSRLGHIFQDMVCLLNGLRWSEVHYTKRNANLVAHSLARHARTMLDEVI